METQQEKKTNINQTIKHQIMVIRNSGETNMFLTDNVMRIANRKGFCELVEYLMDHKKDYWNFIISGKWTNI